MLRQVMGWGLGRCVGQRSDLTMPVLRVISAQRSAGSLESEKLLGTMAVKGEMITCTEVIDMDSIQHSS